jgi:ArsR family transcriptional regulator, arsenate/arsenite/antimonite-responsive transcriptional repressor
MELWMETQTALDCLRALGQEHRLAAFRALVQAGPAGLCVGELREALGIPGPTLSAHLNQLRQAGLVRDQREGRQIQLAADFARMNALLAYLTENCCAGADCGPTSACALPTPEASP